MSFLVPYWTWANPGPFYGMPWVNLAGWMGTGVVLMGILELLGARSWGAELPNRWVAAFYGLNLLLPAGMLLAAGVWVPVLATLIAVAAPFLLTRAWSGRWQGTSGMSPQELTS